MEQNGLNDSGDSKRGKRNTRSQSKKNAHKSSQNQSEASSSFEVVHFMPNDIIPTILECKEEKVVRYPITTIGKFLKKCSKNFFKLFVICYEIRGCQV